MENTNSNTTLTTEDIELALQLFNENTSRSIAANNTLRNEFDYVSENIDPINEKILSERNLLNYSMTIFNSVNTYSSLVTPSNGQTVEEATEAFKQGLVDSVINKHNPIYNYKLYSDEEKNNFVSIGTFVVNDYELIEVEENEYEIFWQIKILGDTTDTSGLTGSNTSNEISDNVWDNSNIIPRLSIRLQGLGNNTIVNNKYYISVPDIMNMKNGQTVELYTLQDDSFVSSEMYLEVYKNTKLRRTGNGSNPGRRRPPMVGHYKVAVVEVNVPLDPKHPRGPKIIEVITTTYTYYDGRHMYYCTITTYVLSIGEQITRKHCERMD